ncbi:hypothetical protein QCA50_016554 [Cerrena zonata]|uniref:Clavaminate synthase-like protein n=1 Tax=Cerrena zonata TaxID=2478898 RepID=A0AAW0FMT2_9APHY
MSSDGQLLPALDIPHYVPPTATKESLDYAKLAIVDLSKANTREGLVELAAQVRDAMRDIGFFYIINHGYTQSQNDRIFDIANATFTQVDDDEKRRLEGDFEKTGTYEGYKLPNSWHIDNGIHDKIEQYNINRDVFKREHPEVLKPLLPEVEQFAKHNHFNILHTILRLLAIGLELPEDTFVNIHNFDAPGHSSARFMKYFPRSQDEEDKTSQVWLKGHADIGTISILWSQPISALQILSPDGKWRWIKHIDNALVINAGDSMEFLSGGYYRATIHRVVQPPRDQRGYSRVGVFYFAMADDSVKLTPLSDSPVLQRYGIKRRFEDSEAPTMEKWRKGVTTAYGKTQLKKLENGHEQELINGIPVTHYNWAHLKTSTVFFPYNTKQPHT